MKKYLGIDVGGQSIRAILISKDGEIFVDNKSTTDPLFTNEEFLNTIDNLITPILKNYDVYSIGIGTPGPLSIEEGIILSSANLVNLKNTPIVSFLKSKTSLPIYFNNDSNVAALGEYYFGKNSKRESLFVFTLGTGLGGGFIYKGEIYNGYSGNGMEVGHTTVVPNGALCGCGQKGCIESYFSTRGFINRYKERTNLELKNAEEFFKKIELKDQIANEILNFGIECFSDCIRNVVHLLNPIKIVFLGGLSKSYSIYGNVLEEKVKSKIFPILADVLEFSVGNEMAGLLGSASLGFKNE
jgi:glucokinase